MKTILTPIEDKGAQAQLELALDVAQIFGGHIDGVAPRTMIDAPMFVEGLANSIEEWDRRVDAELREAANAFRSFMTLRGVLWEDTPDPIEKASARWIADIDRGPAIVGQLARLYDVTVLMQPAKHTYTDYYVLMETILFESGRPILFAPMRAAPSLGRTVVIAWNGSTESARATASARPFLDRAEQVHVLSVEGSMVAGPNAKQVQGSLRRIGIASEIHVIGKAGRSTGEAILEETTKLGGDLLIKGAYTRSPLRQMIFGGATNHVLKKSTVPILMTH